MTQKNIMILKIPSPRRLFWIKLTVVAIAIALLFLKSDSSYSNIPLIIALLPAGYYLGKLTCGVHFKTAGIQLTIAVFVLMNLVHSFTDGVSFTGQPVIYWLSAVGAHEIIRQPALYFVLWALLRPAALSKPAMVFICIICVTITWVCGLLAGAISSLDVQHLSIVAKWAGYSIFLFVGDIVHHFVDQYRMIWKD